MDEKLLLEIFHIPAMSKQEDDMARFIMAKLTELNVPFFLEEKSGTIYNLSNKNRPLLAAHTDTVQKNLDALLTKYIKIKNGVLSGYGVIGGDDKCGIFIILELLKKYPDLNFAFFPSEEIGCVGSREFVKHVTDFSNVPYGLVLDRRSATDIICDKNSYGTKKFDETLETIGKDFGYKSVLGAVSDANTLREFISCANIGVAYNNPHTTKEYVIIEELQKAMDFVEAIITSVKEKFDKPVVAYVYKGGYNDYGYDDYGVKKGKRKSYGYWSKCDICKLSSNSTKNYIKSLKMYLCDSCTIKVFEELCEIDTSKVTDIDEPQLPLLPAVDEYGGGWHGDY